MSKDEKFLLFSLSKIEVKDLEKKTGEPILEYINTLAIGINLMLESGFIVKDKTIHYYQLIEAEYAEVQEQVAFIKEYFKD